MFLDKVLMIIYVVYGNKMKAVITHFYPIVFSGKMFFLKFIKLLPCMHGCDMPLVPQRSVVNDKKDSPRHPPAAPQNITTTKAEQAKTEKSKKKSCKTLEYIRS